MAAQIAHVLFIDIVAWSKGSMENMASGVEQLADSLRATPSFVAAESAKQLGLIPTGDGMAILFFGELTAPARCALELKSELPLRMGIHSGPIQRKDDVTGHENFFGDGVNLAKRVLDFAEEGEILLSGDYAKWLIQFDEWRDRLHERGEGTAKHGVQIPLWVLDKITEFPSEVDTGGVPPGSPYYVQRLSDSTFDEAMRMLEPIILVKGPRQIGKTSLLSRGLVSAQKDRRRLAFTDFQKFGGQLLLSDEAFYRALAATVAKQIGFLYDFANEWDPIYGATMNMEMFLRAALESSEQPLIWMMDEADKLFGVSFASDFYGLVRSWHNSRATDPNGPWGRLCVIIGYATEAHLFIQDLNQSPFNVGRRIDLEEFNETQVGWLNERMGRPLAGPDEVKSLMDLVGGHPFLVRRALNIIKTGMSLNDLLATSSSSDGPFGDHLKRVYLSVTQQPAVQLVIREVLANQTPTNREALSRLTAAGVLREDPNEVSVRNMLYRRYLATLA